MEPETQLKVTPRAVIFDAEIVLRMPSSGMKLLIEKIRAKA